MHMVVLRALTFDMRGGRQLAKPDVARPLDGRVSPQRVACTAEKGRLAYGTHGCSVLCTRSRAYCPTRDAPAFVFRCIDGHFRVTLLHRKCDTVHSIVSREWHTRADRLAFRSVGLPRPDERNLLFLGASAPCPLHGASTACRWLATFGRVTSADRLVRKTALLAGTPDAPCTCCTCWGLTFDMRGGRQQAKPDVGRPLDGRVRRLEGNAGEPHRNTDASLA